MVRTDPSRFDRVVQHPEYNRAPDRPVLPAESVGIATAIGPMAITMFGFLFFLIVVTMLDLMPLVIAVALIGGALVVLLGGVGMIAKLVEFRNAPVHRFVAVIVKERSEIGGGGDSPATTTYFTTLQMRDGKRFELYTYRSLVGRIAVDDIGVAYMKSRTLVEFIRFDVD
jgi:hypothetical protein